MITSVTTASAFFATAVSKIIPIKSFGVWAGWVILFNYLYFITMFPALIMIQYYYPILECCGLSVCCSRCPCAKCRCRERPCRREEEEEEAGDNKELQTTFEDDSDVTPAKKLEDQYPEFDEPVKVEKDATEEEDNIKWRRIEKCFKDEFSDFLFRFKFVILFSFLVIAAVGAYAVSQLEPPPGIDQNFRSGTYWDDLVLMTTEDIYADPFYNNIEVATFWGIKGVDRKGEDIWEAGVGKLQWDDSFDLTSADAQSHIFTLCGALRNNSVLAYQDDEDGREVVDCFMESFSLFIGDDFPKDYSSEADLVSDLEAFLEYGDNEKYKINNRIGIENGQVRFVEITHDRQSTC